MMPKSMVMGAAIHESGGARMGDDPASSVLNRFNQAWDAPNLFVTDASALPRAAGVNPSLTIAANALRTGTHVLESL